MGDLRQRYDGVEAVLGDVTVATEVTGRLHRPKGDGEPWCNSTTNVEYVETAVALEYGAELCKSCYRPALAHLARMESSPVEDRHADATTPPEVASDTAELPTADPEPLDAITPAVLVATGGASTYHAPAAGDEPLCGETVDTTRRRLDQTPPAARPCSVCFTGAVVAEYDGRDADEHAVVEAVADGGR
jgi:hypothetical protein